MTWFGIDGARQYLDPTLFALSGGKKPTRKVIYGMVADGLRVSRAGDSDRRDSRGRRVASRMSTCAEWIDEYLIGKSEKTSAAPRRVA